MPSILAIIPARSGSKSVPHKNIRTFAGKPLLAWSIEQAKESKTIQRIVVSTDSRAYAKIARSCGAEVPFIRPRKYSKDTSTDLEVFRHALSWLAENEGYRPDICVHLRPTAPVRREGLIDEVVRCLCANPDADAVRTVAPAPHTPYKMWHKGKSGVLKPLLKVPGLRDPWNQARQVLPATWIQTGSVDVVWTRTLLRKNSMTGSRILGFEDDLWVDIDTEEDFVSAEQLMIVALALRGDCGGQALTFCFDLDGVLADTPPGLNYRRARPRHELIDMANALKAAGHRIVIHTARGSVTGIDWKGVTKAQLRKWKLKSDELIMGKPAGDFYIDDRAMHVSRLEALLRMAGKTGTKSRR